MLTLPFCIPLPGRGKRTRKLLSLPASTFNNVLYLRTNNSRLQVCLFDIDRICALLNIISRYADGDILRHEGHVDSPQILPTAVTSHSPVSSPSWDRSSVSSAESGFVSDVPTAEPIPEQIGFGGMYYDHTQHSHYHPRWEFKFPDPGHGHSASSRTLDHSPDVHVVSSPQLVGSRGEFSTRPLTRLGSDEISYTDEANSKISNRLRRRCFNCKAIETSTWRRSVLSPGKLVGHQGYLIERGVYLSHSQLCNKCGLFERTHSIPRPKKFPRRRTHGSKVIRPPTTHPDMRTSFINRHFKDTEPPSLPTTQLLHALDPISGEIYPQHTPWNSPDATPARVSRCYTTTEPASVYHQSGQFPPTALSGAIWI